MSRGLRTKPVMSDLYTFFYKNLDDGQNKTHLTSYLQNIIDILSPLLPRRCSHFLPNGNKLCQMLFTSHGSGAGTYLPLNTGGILISNSCQIFTSPRK